MVFTEQFWRPDSTLSWPSGSRTVSKIAINTHSVFIQLLNEWATKTQFRGPVQSPHSPEVPEVGRDCELIDKGRIGFRCQGGTPSAASAKSMSQTLPIISSTDSFHFCLFLQGLLTRTQSEAFSSWIFLLHLLYRIWWNCCSSLA
jgi:hypothetical protein